MYGRALPCRAMLAAVLAVPAFVAGCSDSAAPDGRVEVHAIRLTVGEQVITIEQGGAVTGGPLVIEVGDIGLTAQFLDQEGELAPVAPADYRIEIVSDDEDVVTFARQTAFAGTLTGMAAGSARLAACLLRVAGEECQIGSLTAMVVPVTVEEPDTGDGGDGDGSDDGGGSDDGDGSDDGEGEGA